MWTIERLNESSIGVRVLHTTRSCAKAPQSQLSEAQTVFLASSFTVD